MKTLKFSTLNPGDSLVFMFFFCAPIIKSGGEIIFLLTALFGMWIFFKNHKKSEFSVFEPEDIIIFIAISLPFFLRFISLSWSEFSPFWKSSALTNIHYALWPFIYLSCKKSDNPFGSMLSGISYASIVGSAWIVFDIFFSNQRDINLLSLDYSLGAQHSGVLAHIMCLYAGFLATSILFDQTDKRWLFWKIIPFLLTTFVMLGAAKRIQFGILILLTIYYIIQISIKSRPTTHRLSIGIALAIIIFSAVALLAPKFITAYNEIINYFSNDSISFSSFNSSVGARIEHYYVGYKAWLAHPWLGYGVGIHPGQLASYSHDPENFDFQKLRHFHNQYLQVLIEVGLIGASISLFGLFILFKKQCIEIQGVPLVQIQFVTLYATFILTGLFSISVGQGLVNSVFIISNAVLWAQLKKAKLNIR